MGKENWSLKESKKIKISIIQLLDCLGFVDTDQEVYPAKDIETLRQKLIEDFYNWCNERIEYKGNGNFRHITTDEIGINEFKESVNKRFGVEE